MEDLIKICDEMVAVNTSLGCSNETFYGYPKLLIVGKKGATITAVGDVPTPAEMQTWLNLGQGFGVPVSNGIFIEPTLQSREGADTEDGLRDVTREDNGITGMFNRVSDDTIRMFTQNNLNNSRAQLWIVDSNDKLHGAKEGFRIPFYIKNFAHSGYGNNAKVMVEMSWERKVNTFYPTSVSNVDYQDLVNYISEGIYTETVVTTYVLGQVTGYNNITGWTKATYPTLYAKIVSNVITFYASDAGRTAGTGALATCDCDASLTVVEAGSSGFGGTLSFVSNAIVDNSKWNIAFS